MFSVDYTTLQQIIQQFAHTGVFRAYVIKSRLLSEEGHVELQAKEGAIIACRFVTKQGQIHVWDRWEIQLTRIGVLNWEQIPDNTVPPRAISPAKSLLRQPVDASLVNNRSSIPHHTLILDSYQMQQMPMLYRRVYYLIDGKRQFSDIAHMLHKSEQEIVQVINELIRRGIIVLK